MKTLLSTTLLAGVAALAACAPAPAPISTAGTVVGTCPASSAMDVNNDGVVTMAEWNNFRAAAYGGWDVNHDGRITMSEFEGCYRAGGFYPTSNYNPDYWNNYWKAFDANGDGWLSRDEYWAPSTWTRVDRNNNGRIDADEWMWWGS